MGRSGYVFPEVDHDNAPTRSYRRSPLRQGKIKAAVESAVRGAVLRHKQAGNPIVGMMDGKMVWLKPEEIVV